MDERLPRTKPNRTPRFIAIGAALAAIVAAYIYFWQSRPIGNGPAGPNIPANSFSHPWSQKHFFVVGLGDSVTAGFGSRHGYGYFDRVIANPADDFADAKDKSLSRVLPNLQFTNLAVSGSTSFEHVAHQLPCLPLVDSNTVGIVLLTTGGNDLIHNYGRTPPREEAMYGATWAQASPWVTNFEHRLEKIVEQLHDRFPAGCHIFVATIFDPTDGVGDISRAGLPSWSDGLKILAAYNDVIKKCAERHPFVHVVDIHHAFLGHGLHCTQFWSAHYDSRDPHYWYYSNLEDPNERGYDAMRRLFLIEIAKMAKEFQ